MSDFDNSWLAQAYEAVEKLKESIYQNPLKSDYDELQLDMALLNRAAGYTRFTFQEVIEATTKAPLPPALVAMVQSVGEHGSQFDVSKLSFEEKSAIASRRSVESRCRQRREANRRRRQSAE